MLLKKANTSMLAPMTKENRPLRFELFKKIILAGEKYDLPYISPFRVYDENVWNIVCDFGDSGVKTLEILTSLRQKQANPRKRLDMVLDYLNGLQKNLDSL